jgi:SGNH domain (fused to AT3 domains)
MAALLLVASACAGGSPQTAERGASGPGPSTGLPQGQGSSTGSPPAGPSPSAPSPGRSSTATSLTMTPAQARADTGELLRSGCYAQPRQSAAPDPEDCSFGFFDGDTVVLYGDSHAAQWFGAAVEVADRHGWRLLPVTKADCPPGGESVVDPDGGEYTECVAWHARAMDLIRAQEPILVLLAARSDRYRIVGDGGEPLSSTGSAERLGRALADDLRAFADMGARTVLIRDTQVPGFDVPDCIEADGPEACRYGLGETSPDDSAQRAAAKASGSDVVDLRQEVCGDRADCFSAVGGLITFRDAEHLTSTFATSLADELEAGIEALPA